MGPIQIEDLGLNDTFEKMERLANLLDEVNKIVESLKEEDIDINFKIELT